MSLRDEAKRIARECGCVDAHDASRTEDIAIDGMRAALDAAEKDLIEFAAEHREHKQYENVGLVTACIRYIQRHRKELE